MPRENTPEEKTTKREMTSVYKSQEDMPDGFEDWGIFTAHVVYEQRREIDRLRDFLKQNGIEPLEWDDPLEA